jgi:hypothetical protein
MAKAFGMSIGKPGWGLYAEVNTADPGKGAHVSAIFPEPGLFTVQLSVLNRISSAGYKSNPIAVIKWMLNGQHQTRKISITHGCSITGVGEAASVTIYDDSVGLLGTDQVYQVMAQIAVGNRTGTEPVFFPTMTGTTGQNVGVVSIAGMGYYNVPIPQETGVMAVNVSSCLFPLEVAAGEFLTLYIVSSTGATAIRDIGLHPDSWIPLPVNTLYLRIYNGSASDHNFSVTFKVDG